MAQSMGMLEFSSRHSIKQNSESGSGQQGGNPVTPWLAKIKSLYRFHVENLTIEISKFEEQKRTFSFV
jgi:hypothetical protein